MFVHASLFFEIMPACPSQLCPLAGRRNPGLGSGAPNHFETIEALMEHANEARSQHPLCDPCQRVFKDKMSRQQVRIPYSLQITHFVIRPHHTIIDFDYRFALSFADFLDGTSDMTLDSTWKRNMSSTATHATANSTPPARWKPIFERRPSILTVVGVTKV